MNLLGGQPPNGDLVTFEDWICRRTLLHLGTNAGAKEIPFQNWRRFKEAFAPELIAKAVLESEIPVNRCLDPFGGSGTTSLACQYLGVEPITIEVNPYLADLIEAKLTLYDPSSVRRAFARVRSVVDSVDVRSDLKKLLEIAPQTFCEPGVENRFVFFKPVLKRLLSYRKAIERLRNPANRRLFEVLLGSIAIPVSNVTVSGKGRRYRGGWEKRKTTAADVDRRFSEQISAALSDIEKCGRRQLSSYSVLRGDARKLIDKIEAIDLVVCSPPYPNSADYTDVYNVELWIMGYLKHWDDNISLRRNTLSSHVQLKREYASAPPGSELLSKVISNLRRRRSALWHPDIPEMVGAYFSDINHILLRIKKCLSKRGRVYIVLGDSRYDRVLIPTASIVATLAQKLGYTVISAEASRSMRLAPQQGGRLGLAETLLILRRD